MHDNFFLVLLFIAQISGIFSAYFLGKIYGWRESMNLYKRIHEMTPEELEREYEKIKEKKGLK